MKKEVKSALISGVLGIVGTVAAAIIGMAAGKSNEQKNILKEIQTSIATIDGDNNQIIFNDVSEITDKYEELKIEYTNSQNDYDNLNELYIQQETELSEAKSEIIDLQKELNDLANDYNTDVAKKPDVEYSNISLIINGIESGYVGRVATINNETFYSGGFLEYLVDSQAVSSDTSKLFIGTVQSEDKMPVSLFELEPFTESGYLNKTTNEKDNYGNVFPEALQVISSDWDYEELLSKATEYFINGEYSTFCFDVAYSQYALQGFDYEILILGDGNVLKSIVIDRKTKIQSIEVSVANVDFLQIVGRCNDGWKSKDIYSLIISPYLYP